MGQGICLGLRRNACGPVVESLDAVADPFIREVNDMFCAISFDPPFYWTSLQVSRNMVSSDPTDANWSSDRVVVVLGDFLGGEFVCNGEPHDLHAKALRFDGSLVHSSKPFQGRDRFCIIAFCHRSWPDVSPSLASSLHAFGFQPPSTTDPSPELPCPDAMLAGWPQPSAVIPLLLGPATKCRRLQASSNLAVGDISLDKVRQLTRRLTATELAWVTKTEAERDTSDEEEPGVPRPKRGTGCWGNGPPLSIQLGGRVKPFADGAGLCSPGRWMPEKRFLASTVWENAAPLTAALKAALSSALDVKRVMCELAAGRHRTPPFSQELLVRGAQLCATVLGRAYDADTLLTVAPGQCVRLTLIGELLRALSDPDWRVYSIASTNFADGVPLGYRLPLPRTPSVFERKRKWKAYTEDELSWQVEGDNGTTDERAEPMT